MNCLIAGAGQGGKGMGEGTSSRGDSGSPLSSASPALFSHIPASEPTCC